MLLEFENLSRPVLLKGMTDAPPAFDGVFRYWLWRPLSEHDAEPVIRVTPKTNGFLLQAPWLEEPLNYTDEVNLACGLAVQVNHAMLAERPDLLCLHGAGIEIDGRLVVFPNTYRAGKSLMTGCLAAAGARIFSDDILPVDRRSGQGMAIGVPPRLRLPVPDTAGVRSRRFIEENAGPANAQYLYLDLDENRQARYGEQRPFAGFVLLARAEDAQARLEPASEGEVLKELFLRNFARPISAAESLDFLNSLLARAACYKLTYSVGDDGADLLMAKFRDREAVERDVDLKANAVASMLPGPNPAPTSNSQIRRNPDIAERFVGDDLFLVAPSGESVYHLNPVGAGLWHLLDGSCSVDEAKSVLRQAFPDAAAPQIDRDVDSLVQDLLQQNLLCEPRKT